MMDLTPLIIGMNFIALYLFVIVLFYLSYELITYSFPLLFTLLFPLHLPNFGTLYFRVAIVKLTNHNLTFRRKV